MNAHSFGKVIFFLCKNYLFSVHIYIASSKPFHQLLSSAIFGQCLILFVIFLSHSFSLNSKIKVWNLNAALNPLSKPSQLCIHTLQQHTGRVFRLQFDDFQIVSSSHDDTILIWDFVRPASGNDEHDDGFDDTMNTVLATSSMRTCVPRCTLTQADPEAGANNERTTAVCSLQPQSTHPGDAVGVPSTSHTVDVAAVTDPIHGTRNHTGEADSEMVPESSTLPNNFRPPLYGLNNDSGERHTSSSNPSAGVRQSRRLRPTDQQIAPSACPSKPFRNLYSSQWRISP